MTTLRDAIQAIDGWQTKTAEELHAELDQVRTEPNPTPYTMVALGEALGEAGPAIRSLVNFTMFRIANGELSLPAGKEPLRADIDSARIAMSATAEGLSLHTPERQGLIDLLGSVGQWAPEVIQAVKGLGVRTYKLFNCTLGEVEAALDWLALDAAKGPMRIAAAQRYNAYISALDAWDGSGEGPVL